MDVPQIVTAATRDWAPRMKVLAEECPPLDVYPVHIYTLCLRDFGNTCSLAIAEGKLVGFATGYLTGTDRYRFFLWQIGVAGEWRRSGVATGLVNNTFSLARDTGAGEIFVTVDPDNVKSLNLFRKLGFAAQNGLFGDEVTPADGSGAARNHYRSGSDQVILVRRLPQTGQGGTSTSPLRGL